MSEESIYQIHSILFIILAISFTIAMLFLIIVILKRKQKNNNALSKTRKKDELSGIVFGKDRSNFVFSPTEDEGHVVVFGGSGSGKTSAILIPTLRSWTGTSFTIDISGDISKNVKMNNKIIYNPSSSESVSYNVFESIDNLKTINEKNEKLSELAFLLMPEPMNMSDNAKYFLTEGRKILISSLIAFYHEGFDFVEICKKIVSSSWKSLFHEIDLTNNEKAIQYINSFEGSNEQNTAGCKQAADSAIILFATDETVKKAIGRPLENKGSFSPQDIENHNVFVLIDDHKLELYSPLLNIILAQSLDFFSTRSDSAKHTILFNLDEFASFGKMEILGALRKLRKKKVRIMIITQSMADIELVYGYSERKAMMDNFLFKVVLSASDNETQKYFSELIGYETITKKSTTKSYDHNSITITNERKLILEPSELDRLGDNLLLIFPGGYKKLKKNFYFK